MRTAKKETQTIEFKQSWRDDFLKEICGFANAQGRILVVGVDDVGNERATRTLPQCSTERDLLNLGGVAFGKFAMDSRVSIYQSQSLRLIVEVFA